MLQTPPSFPAHSATQQADEPMDTEYSINLQIRNLTVYLPNNYKSSSFPITPAFLTDNQRYKFLCRLLMPAWARCVRLVTETAHHLVVPDLLWIRPYQPISLYSPWMGEGRWLHPHCPYWLIHPLGLGCCWESGAIGMSSFHIVTVYHILGNFHC